MEPSQSPLVRTGSLTTAPQPPSSASQLPPPAALHLALPPNCLKLLLTAFMAGGGRSLIQQLICQQPQDAHQTCYHPNMLNCNQKQGKQTDQTVRINLLCPTEHQLLCPPTNCPQLLGLTIDPSAEMHQVWLCADPVCTPAMLDNEPLQCHMRHVGSGSLKLNSCNLIIRPGPIKLC